MPAENTTITESKVEVSSSSKPLPRTIYDASMGEVFFKNFMAGLGQAMGHIFMYLIFVAIMAMLVIRFVWPIFKPYVDMYQQSMESIQQMQSWIPGSSSNSQGGENGEAGTNQRFNIQLDTEQFKNLLPQQGQQNTDPGSQ
jgi:hypothetical protein